LDFDWPPWPDNLLDALTDMVKALSANNDVIIYKTATCTKSLATVAHDDFH